MSFNTFFDHIFCLNLDERTDRWEESQAEFKKHNIENVERVSAIRGTSLNLPLSNNIDENGYVHPPHIGGINVGAIGNCITTLLILKIAKRSGYKNILILEDDVVFHENLNEEFNKIVPQIPAKWDLIYLGGNHFAGKPIFHSENVFRVTHTVCLHAVAVNHTMYDKLIDKLTDLSTLTDKSFADLQITNNCFVTSPHLAWQRGGYSDIQTSVQGYEFLQSFESAQY
jgi:GR25 family glycosyltransferase involved in LPS biosynthesis